jgi:hypothetical protein
MAHFAKLDDNNNVIDVVVVNNDALDSNNEEASGIAFLTEWSNGYRNWRQTSYNGNIRANYASVGYKYDVAFDAFIPPQPFPSWKLNYTTFKWEAPVAKPDTVEGYIWLWSEINKEWIQVAI